MAANRSVMFGRSWTEVSGLGSQVFGQPSMESYAYWQQAGGLKTLPLLWLHGVAWDRPGVCSLESLLEVVLLYRRQCFRWCPLDQSYVKLFLLLKGIKHSPLTQSIMVFAMTLPIIAHTAILSKTLQILTVGTSKTALGNMSQSELCTQQ